MALIANNNSASTTSAFNMEPVDYLPRHPNGFTYHFPRPHRPAEATGHYCKGSPAIGTSWSQSRKLPASECSGIQCVPRPTGCLLAPKPIRRPFRQKRPRRSKPARSRRFPKRYGHNDRYGTLGGHSHRLGPRFEHPGSLAPLAATTHRL